MSDHNNHGFVPADSESADRECAEFQALMPERIGAGEDLQSYEHMQTCERCQALIRELEEIVSAVRILIPVEVEEDPPDEIWAKLQVALREEQA